MADSAGRLALAIKNGHVDKGEHPEQSRALDLWGRQVQSAWTRAPLHTLLAAALADIADICSCAYAYCTLLTFCPSSFLP